jgi:hypothetical protein
MDLAALHHDVVFGSSGGKIIWQPRIGCWYSDKRFAGEALPEPYTGKSIPEIYRELGCSARLYGWYNRCFVYEEDPSVRVVSVSLNETDTETRIETPVGVQRAVDRTSPNSPRKIRLKWPISDRSELKVAIWRTERGNWKWDQNRYDEARAEVGDLGAATAYLPRVNVQDLYINAMGVEAAVYALADYPDTVEAYFQAMDENHDRLIDITCSSSIDIINYGDNLHAGTLPPYLYERYVQPAYLRRGSKLHAAGKFVHSHWDGDTAPLLQFAQTSSLDGIEAITPKPQGDVTLQQVKDALGDQVFLIDGLPAVYFDDYYSVGQLEDCVHELIELFAPKLVLGISDELSSTGDIERVRRVGEIVEDYNARQDAGAGSR